MVPFACGFSVCTFLDTAASESSQSVVQIPSAVSSPLPVQVDDAEIQVTFDQSWPTVSFSESAFGPYLTVTTMRPDGHCGFRAIARAILKCQDDWNDIRTSLLSHLESYGEDDVNPYVLAAGTSPEFSELKDSPECYAAEGAPRSQRFHDTWHGQLVTDLYNVFLVSAEKIGGGTHWIYISQCCTRCYSVRQSTYRTAIR